MAGKVERLLEEYDLDGVGAALERRWLGEGEQRQSLRDLARFFNRRLLERAMRDAGMEVLDGEADNVYRLLTDDDVSSGMRTQTRNRLERNGIDVDALERDFVSRQAIHTYLTESRGLDAPTTTDTDPIETDTETLQRLKSRVAAVAEQLLADLREADHLSLGEFSLLVAVQVQCSDCGSQYEIVDLLDRGGCDCRPDGS